MHNIVLCLLPADVAPQPRPRTTSSEDTPQPKPRIHRQNSKNSELVRALYIKGCQVGHLILFRLCILHVYFCLWISEISYLHQAWYFTRSIYFIFVLTHKYGLQCELIMVTSGYSGIHYALQCIPMTYGA